MKQKSSIAKTGTLRPAATFAALAAAFSLQGAGPVAAAEFKTGNPDLSVRWDNTVRLNYGLRVEGRDRKIGNASGTDEGTYRFGRGDAVTERIDLLSEFDVVYRRDYGVRVSAAAWGDAAYGSRSRSNPNPPLVNIPSYVDRQYSGYTKRYYRGPAAEILDAFVFGGFELRDVPVKAKLGRHSLYWGESLLVGGNLHSVAYGQNPLDLQKGAATPGVEAKELFRPLSQLSMQAQVTDTLSLAAQYLFEWEPFRFAEGGTYLGAADFAFNGPDRQFLSPALGFAQRGGAHEPQQDGEWGVAARWSPQWLDGTLGLYYRSYADKLPQILLTQVGPGTSAYRLFYADNIDLYGVSLAKSIGGISVGAELSYRRNTPLASQVFGVAPGPVARGDTLGARGDTVHALVNAVGVIAQTPLFDSANWAAELTWSYWDKVRSGENLFNARGFAPCKANGTTRLRDFDKWDGCVTKSFVGLGLSFTPTWFQVYPGVDLSAPLTFSMGLSGNAATAGGGNQRAGSYSVGLGADIRQKYRVDLRYVDYLGRYRADPAGFAVATQNGPSALLKDRGFVSLTFKTTF